MKKITIYTDGTCKGNPGPGGWGAVLIFEDDMKKICGGEKITTNNKMELSAAINALDNLSESCQIDLYTDSSYLKNGITSWLENWIKKNWKTASGKPVKNKELWDRLSHLTKKHTIKWYWVKGHSNNEYNEIADNLANQGCEKFM